LEEESYIKFHETYFFGPAWQPISGATVDSQIFAEPTQTCVMRSAGPSAIADVDAATVPGDEVYYDMQGHRVAEPAQPGIYVRDGKKIVVK
ncbi:MAG: hypothetical protein J6S96_01170, partial [Muribaculaceae bacterium]|nr:hypothetical protein [Muribaculaceae bacterium]